MVEKIDLSGKGKGKPKTFKLSDVEMLSDEMKKALINFADKEGIAVSDIPLPEGGVKGLASDFMGGAMINLQSHLTKVEKQIEKKEENNTLPPKIKIGDIYSYDPGFYEMLSTSMKEPIIQMPKIKPYYSGMQISGLEELAKNLKQAGYISKSIGPKTNPLPSTYYDPAVFAPISPIVPTNPYLIATTNNPQQMDKSLKEKFGKHYGVVEEAFTDEMKKLTHKEKLDMDAKAKVAQKKANIEAEKKKKLQAEEKKKQMEEMKKKQEEEDRKYREAIEKQKKEMEEAQRKIKAEQKRIQFISDRIENARNEKSSDKKDTANELLLPGMADEGKSLIVRASLKPKVTFDGNRVLYDFGEAGYEKIDEVGGKGAGLTEMVRLGMPVPQGFTISSRMVNRAYSEMRDDILEAIARIEDKSGRKFGDTKNPLLVSVRSGAKVSMPGMMESILNVGVNEEVLEKSDNVLLYAKCYEALLESFGRNIFGIDYFSHESQWLRDVKQSDLATRINYFREMFKNYKKNMPQDPDEQLAMAIKAVFDSWNSKKAKEFREVEKISADMGTAVNIQRMVYGNYGNKSLTAVVFSRDPATGQKGLFGSFMKDAQGEQLVSGGNSLPLSEAPAKVRKEMEKHSATLEEKFKDMQDMEITVEDGKLYLLQTRKGKRTTRAAIRIALDLAKEGVISEKDALMKIKPESLRALKGKEIAPGQQYNVMGKGTAVSPGIAQGYAVFDSNGAEGMKSSGRVPILVRRILDTSDIKAINDCEGIATIDGDGNSISHAIVVARSKNRAVIVGSSLQIYNYNFYSKDGNIKIRPGQEITINANTGEVILGHPKLIDAEPGEETNTLLEMTKKYHEKDFVVVTSNPKEVNGVNIPVGVLYIPGANLSQEDIAQIKETVAGKGTREEVEKGFYEFYMQAIKKIKGEKTPLIIGLSPLEAFESLVPDRKVLRFREKTLEDIVRQTNRMKEKGKKVEKIGVGSTLNYYGRAAKITKVKETGCPCCSGYNLKFLDNGEEEWVHKTAFKRNASDFKPVDMSGHLGGVVSQLKKVGRANPARVYQAQLDGARRAIKESGKEGIMLMEYSGQNEITIQGKTYEIVSKDDLVYKSLVAAQEAIGNGK